MLCSGQALPPWAARAAAGQCHGQTQVWGLWCAAGAVCQGQMEARLWKGENASEVNFYCGLPQHR